MEFIYLFWRERARCGRGNGAGTPGTGRRGAGTPGTGRRGAVREHRERAAGCGTGAVREHRERADTGAGTGGAVRTRVRCGHTGNGRQDAAPTIYSLYLSNQEKK